MPLRPFTFENTSNETPNDRNWRIFAENSKTFVYRDATALTMTSPVGTPTIPQATFTFYGPLVYFVMYLSIPSGSGWSLSSYITMPFQQYRATTLQVPMSPIAEVYFWNTGAKITTAVFGNNNFPERLSFAGAYTNTSGVTLEPFIQGWYYRG